LIRAAGALVVAALLFAACGGEDEGEPEDSGAREAAAEWAELAVAGDPAACDLTTGYGQVVMVSWTGTYFKCDTYGKGAERIPDALLLEDPEDLAAGLATASEADATGREGEAVTRLSFPVEVGTVEVDLVNQDGEWLFNDARAVADPLAGEGSEEIDPAAIEGVDRSDPADVLAKWGALAAAKDPSACLLTDPGLFVYSVVRQEIAESCADMVTSGFPMKTVQIGDDPEPATPAVFARAAATADLVKEVPGRADPSESRAYFRKELPNGDEIEFDLVKIDGEWAVASSGASREIGPGEPLLP
jgi:hypothetical protein